MLESVFNSILTSTQAAGIAFWEFAICLLVSLALGAVIAALFMFRNTYTKSFVATLALLPAIVQVVIMLVNGNLGTGVAVMGAFSLIRFRSAPGSAKEICSIFLAMATGLCTGMGYLGIAVVCVLVIGGAGLLYTALGFGGRKSEEKELRVTIPEGLEYTGVFDDLFSTYTQRAQLVRVKTSHMGSLYQLQYHIVLNDETQEKALIDAIRCRNGNLEIVCGRLPATREEL